MGIFSKKPRTEACPMCDAVVTEEDRWTHKDAHIAMITADGPAWLPEGMRRVAQGEYTFKCDRCSTYPSIKWPSDGGASAGMEMHLGKAHNIGALRGMPRNAGIQFDMIPIE